MKKQYFLDRKRGFANEFVVVVATTTEEKHFCMERFVRITRKDAESRMGKKNFQGVQNCAQKITVKEAIYPHRTVADFERAR